MTKSARWEKRGYLFTKEPVETRSIITVCPFYSNSHLFFIWFQTQVIFKWVEPKICLENVTGAVTLPPSGEREPCPPCNPGFYNNDTATCSPCPPGTFSDGMKRTENFLSYSPHLSSTYLLFHAVSQLCFSLFVPSMSAVSCRLWAHLGLWVQMVECSSF